MENKEENTLKESRINWIVSADVECPHCQSTNDFMDVDEWHFHCQVGENAEKLSNPCEMTCNNCKKEFMVVGSDY